MFSYFLLVSLFDRVRFLFVSVNWRKVNSAIRLALRRLRPTSTGDFSDPVSCNAFERDLVIIFIPIEISRDKLSNYNFAFSVNEIIFVIE